MEDKPKKKRGRPPNEKTMGRPTKLTPEVQEKIINRLKIGMYVEPACAYAGINKDTYYDWIKRGARGESPYKDFFDAVEEAISSAETRLLTKVQQLAEKQWQAAAWILERRWPHRWCKKEKVEHTGKDGAEIKIDSKQAREEIIKVAMKAREEKKLKPAKKDDSDV